MAIGDTVQCPACGRKNAPGRTTCLWCGAPLPEETTGAGAEAPASGAVPSNLRPRKLDCPRCPGAELVEASLSGLNIARCPQCRGIFLDGHSFDFLIKRQAELALRGEQSETKTQLRGTVQRGTGETQVRYLNCPVCRQQMSRKNYAKCSGVVFDQCMAHGIWLDDEELQQILTFIATGGHRLAGMLSKEAEERIRISQLRSRSAHNPLSATARHLMRRWQGWGWG